MSDIDKIVYTTGRNAFRDQLANPQNRSAWYDPIHLDQIYKADRISGELRVSTPSIEDFAENEFRKIFDQIYQRARCADLYGIPEYEELREQSDLYNKCKKYPAFKKFAAAEVLSVLREFDLVWRGDIQTSLSPPSEMPSSRSL